MSRAAATTKVKLSPGIEHFLRRWERTRGFGFDWSAGKMRTGANGCCPLTAARGLPAQDYLIAAESLRLSACEATDIAEAADADGPKLLAADEILAVIRRRLLRGVGLVEAGS